jgi:ABC-type uncharacterized transport system permease subunit
MAHKKLPTTSREALEVFILHLAAVYYPWYERSVARNYYLWLSSQMIALLAGFGTGLLAALLTEEQFRGLQAGRIALIVLPVLGSVASTVLIQSRVNARWALREEGRIGFQTLLNDARKAFAAASSESECKAIHEELNRKTEKIEKSQSVSFFANAPDFTK